MLYLARGGGGGGNYREEFEHEARGKADINWHPLLLNTLPGKGYALIDYRSTTLASLSSITSLGTNMSDHLKRNLSACLGACARDISFMAPMLKHGVQTPQQNAFSTINKEATVHLERLVALSLKRGGHVNDPVKFLCVRHENLGIAMVFEPGETFGLYLNYCLTSQQEAGTILSLHHPTLGQNKTLDKLLLRKEPVRANEVKEVVMKLTIALNKLSQGDVLLILSNKISSCLHL